MRRIAVLLLLAACGQTQPAAPHPRSASEIRTLDNAGARPAVYDPPPALTDEAPSPGSVMISTSTQAPLTEQDEQLRGRLPFAPAIALDPVDGSTVSIRVSTPTFEYKGHIYYFASEADKSQFSANPEQFTKGVFALPHH
jgi:YHS domain-containing protein